MKSLFLFLLFLLARLCLSQDFQFKKYRVENGLPSDVIKAVDQDSLGYFWIATDEGLVKYDGIEFTQYKSAFHSPYVKGFYHTKKGKLLAFGDLDLIEIINQPDTVYFKPILNGTRSQTDSSLWYPKSIYEDRSENIWIGEPQSVVKIAHGKMTRYNFDLAERSENFLRSFFFFEDHLGTLFVASSQGSLYYLDNQKNLFVRSDNQLPANINSLLIVNNHLLIGAASGVYETAFLKAGGVSATSLKYPVLQVSDLLIMPANRLLVSTHNNFHYLVDRTTGQVTQLPFNINNINHSYRSSENDIWLSCTEGLILLQQNVFKNATKDLTEFIECIAEDSLLHTLYYANMYHLFSIDYSDPHLVSKIVLSVPDGYFQALQINSDGLWAANNSDIFLIKDNRVIKQWNFEKEGRFIHDIFIDSDNNVWASQDSNNQLIVIDSNYSIHQIPVPIEMGNTINLIREGPNGIYASSNGKNAYLLLKKEGEKIFKNISLPVTFTTLGDFNVTDLAFTRGTIWLATTEGLLVYDDKTINRVNLGESLSQMPVKTIKKYIDGSLLFTNAKGLFKYDPASGDYWIFDEDNGLPSNTITARGLFIDHSKRAWIGTSRGLAFSKMPLEVKKTTLKPIFIKAYVNERAMKLTAKLIVPYGSFVRILCNSITFPESKVELQYKIDDAPGWLSIKAKEVSFSDLKSGTHTLEIRAKKNGGYAWSQSSAITILVRHPFWKQSWFYSLCFTAICAIVIISILITNHVNKKRRAYLQKLIDDRTHELKVINTELSHRNVELDRFVYSASHDLSAPLKSILGLVNIAKMENPTDQIKIYLGMMEKSALKLDAFIKDVINYSRNTRLEVKKVPINFSAFIDSIWEDHLYNPIAKNIRFVVDNQLAGTLLCDEMRLRIIFNNLISNAIKFHRIENNPDPFISISATENKFTYQFSVADNGIGIPAEHQGKIFDMFFRANEYATGSGLGLYILKETITKLGGEINMQSEVEKGTAFIFTIPKAKVKQPEVTFLVF